MNKLICKNEKIIIYTPIEINDGCSCDVETMFDSIINMNINTNKLINNIKDIKNIANINFLKCYKPLFNKKSIKTKIGFYIFIPIKLIHIIITIIFILRKYRILMIIIHLKE